MPRLLKRIKKSLWHSPVGGEAPGDCLPDLKTDKNTLSMWSVEDGGANFERIVVAVAATRESAQEFDWALIDLEDVRQLGIQVRSEPGNTPDHEANNWHVHLVELTAHKVAQIAALILAGDRDRILPKDVKKRLKTALDGGQLRREAMDGKLLQELSR